MWVDEPREGISKVFPENTNYGLVNEQDEPYAPLVEACRRLNPRAAALHREGRPPTSASCASPAAAAMAGRPTGRALPIPAGPLTLTSGRLTVEGPLGRNGWRLSAGGVPLGELFPALFQGTRPPQWVAPTTARITSIRRGERGTVVDMEFARAAEPAVAGGSPPAREPGRAYVCGWRYRVPAGSADASAEARRAGWIGSRCLWVRNTDTLPWPLEAVYEHLMPAIGGDAAHDVPLEIGVPQYYRRGGGWVDPIAGLGAACWFPVEADFSCRYTKDDRGGFHPDLRLPVGRILLPGQSLNIDGPPAFYFALDGLTRVRFTELSQQVEREAAGGRHGEAP